MPHVQPHAPVCHCVTTLGVVPEGPALRLARSLILMSPRPLPFFRVLAISRTRQSADPDRLAPSPRAA